jgi:hypothetical protein
MATPYTANSRRVAAIAVGLLLGVAGTASADTLSQTTCAWDNSYSYKVCITQDYTTGSYHGRRTVSIRDYHVRFSGGSNGVSIGGATVLVGVQGVGTRSHSPYLSATQSWKIGTPVMGVRYLFRPRWADDPVIILGPHSYQCGRSDSTLRHGKSKWKLSTPNVCQGSL